MRVALVEDFANDFANDFGVGFANDFVDDFADDLADEADLMRFFLRTLGAFVIWAGSNGSSVVDTMGAGASLVPGASGEVEERGDPSVFVEAD